MGSRIESATAARARGGPFAPGALHLEETTARAALRRAGRRANELDLLVNAGIYKERSLAEPALASIIQEDIGANAGRPRHDRHGTFSFDVANGGCGVLTAAQLVDGFVGPGTARLGIVVAGDSDPDPGRSRGFSFPSVGGALLLAHTDGAEGFERFAFRAFPALAKLFEVTLHFEPETRHNLLDVREDPNFGEACVSCAGPMTLAFLDEQRLSASDVDVLVASQYPPLFPWRLARFVGVPADRIPRVARGLSCAHTAGLIAALDAAIEAESFARARNVLFVAVAAGITVGLALYRRALS